jgi:hypothetical protein
MKFENVKQRHKKVLIVGGGESLVGFDIGSLVDFEGVVITVNSVILHLPRVDYWITGDLARPHKALEKRKKDCYYYAGYPYHILEYALPEGIHYLDKVVSESFTLQEDKNKITGGVDSMYCALNLAYHFEAEEITILGMDCYGYGHWYDLETPYNGYDNPNFDEEYLDKIPEKYENCVKQFEERGTRIVNGSPKSRVDCFKRMKPEEAISYFNK